MTLTGGITLFTLVMYIVAGWWVSRKIKDSESYYVMNRQAPTILILGTIVAAYISTVAFTGIFAVGYRYGMGPAILNWLTIAAWTFSMLYFSPKVYRMRVWTLPELFEKRYGTDRMALVTTVLLILTSVTYLVAILMGVALAMSTGLGISSLWCVILAGGVIVIFSLLGGMWGVVVTDTLMFFLFMFGVLIGFPLIVNQAGGWQKAVKAAHDAIPGMLSATGNMPLFGEPFWSMSGFFGFMLVMGTMSFCMGLTGAHTVSRCFIAKSQKALARAWILAQVFLLVFLTFLYTTAPFTKLLFPQVDPAQSYVVTVNTHFPALIAAIVMAGIAAAGLGHAAALLQMSGASVARDIYKKYYKPDCSDRLFLKISKTFMLITGAVMIVVSLYQPAANFAILYAFLFSACIFTSWAPAMFLGAVFPWITERAAFWSITISMIVNIIWAIAAAYNPWLPHQILVSLPVAIVVVLGISAFDKPSAKEIDGFMLMQSAKYKETHGYISKDVQA